MAITLDVAQAAKLKKAFGSDQAVDLIKLLLPKTKELKITSPILQKSATQKHWHKWHVQWLILGLALIKL